MSDTTAPTRQQRLLDAIASQEGIDWPGLVPRAESLPAMLIRHGVLPVKLFLTSGKTEDRDHKLWEIVEGAVGRVLPKYSMGLTDLSQLSLERYLLLQEVAIESATLVARWAKLKEREEKAKPSPGGVAP